MLPKHSFAFSDICKEGEETTKQVQESCQLNILTLKPLSTMKVLLFSILLLFWAACIKADQDIDLEDDILTETEVDTEEKEDEEIIVPTSCKRMNCGSGKECAINLETGETFCRCVEECGYEVDPRRKVCSNLNVTFPTDCHLHQMRCFCEENDDRCTNQDKQIHMHIQYYGECRNIPECQEEELVDFPRRMREWLFNVMQELAERDELSTFYKAMEKEAATDIAKRWRNAAIWKWCDLDGEPNDQTISRHELFPVRAPLQTLEHCIGDFLDSCDSNSDHRITLKEWGTCLELEINDFEANCEKLGMEQNDVY